MKKIRLPKEDDQENIERAFQLIKRTITRHEEIEPTLWGAACWMILVIGHAGSGYSYEEFCEEWDNVKDHYRSEFEENE
jgi:hypothetical protein